jgi:hypothetical protein
VAKFGDTLTTDDMPTAGGGGPAGYVASYINTTTSLGAFAGSTTATGLQIVNLPVTAGRYYVIDVLFNYSTTNTQANNFNLHDGTNIGQVASMSLGSATSQSAIYGSLLYSPATTGLKTLRLDITKVSGTGTITLMGGTGTPIQMVVTDVGGAPLATSGLGLVGYSILTTSQAGGFNPLTDALSVTFTTVAGAQYRTSLLTPFNKTDSFATWMAAISIAGANQYIALSPAVTSGELGGSVLYIPAAGGTSVTVTATYTRTSGSDNNFSLPGTATAPRQLWVERIG